MSRIDLFDFFFNGPAAVWGLCKLIIRELFKNFWFSLRRFLHYSRVSEHFSDDQRHFNISDLIAHPCLPRSPVLGSRYLTPLVSGRPDRSGLSRVPLFWTRRFANQTSYKILEVVRYVRLIFSIIDVVLTFDARWHWYSIAFDDILWFCHITSFHVM